MTKKKTNIEVLKIKSNYIKQIYFYNAQYSLLQLVFFNERNFFYFNTINKKNIN